ncbi:MAG: hypothetical protein ACK55I_35715, partial [bacterium]
ELEFIQVVQKTGLLRALESQENSLMKTEMLEDITLPALKTLHNQFPVRTEDSVISQIAVSKAIEVDDLTNGEKRPPK